MVTAATFEEDRDRNSLSLRGTLTLPGHTLVTGVDYEDIRVRSAFHSSAVSRILDSSYVTIIGGYNEATFHNRSPAAYVQDSWRVTDRLTLNAGLRWSAQYMVGASGRTDQRITDEWQPRAGFVWQPGRLGTQRIFGSYGRFYQTLPANLAVLMFVNYDLLFTFYSTDPRLPGAVPVMVMDGSSTEADYDKQIPGLHGENHDEYTLGYERLLGARNKLTVRGTYRTLRSSFRIAADLFHVPMYVLGMPGKGDLSFLPPTKREYTSLEVAAEGAWRGVSYRASYVLSRNWGNYPGLYDSDAGVANPSQATGFYGAPPGDEQHRLPAERPHARREVERGTCGGIRALERSAPDARVWLAHQRLSRAYPLWDPGIP